ncbi:hypothetical protein P1X16_23390 [Hymenobacter sp. YC55]|nr:hypothetical protein [Hymenobacter sp. YC55]
MQHTFQYVKQYKAIYQNSAFQWLPLVAAFVSITATSSLSACHTLLAGLRAAFPSEDRPFIYQNIRHYASR